jgi:16S rRNA (guanine527-N7)-methyltransferase
MLSGMQPEQLIEMLARDEIRVPAEAREHWARHAALVREWNAVASLVSIGDARQLETRHLPDAVSLASVVARLGLAEATLLDIGTGGGYPAIPMKIALPGLSVTLVERSVKKVGFLRKVVAALGLQGVEIIHGEFPVAVQGKQAAIVTARAVESPAKVQSALASWMPLEGIFLCQSGRVVEFSGDMFHVEHWEDDWSASETRRGDLYVVRRIR